MSDAVQDGVEETTSTEESQTSVEETTDEELESEDSPSSEDVNTQSEEEEDETVQEARDEVKSPRGENRVQALANEKKRVAQENESLRKEMEMLRQQASMNQPPPQTNEEFVARQFAQQNAQLAATQEDIAWDRAKNSFPELDDASEEYDRDFDNKVYAEYKVRQVSDPSVTPAQVAKDFKDYLSRVASKAASKAEGTKNIKRSITSASGSRTEAEDSTSTNVSKSMDKWLRSGAKDDESLDELLKNF